MQNESENRPYERPLETYAQVCWSHFVFRRKSESTLSLGNVYALGSVTNPEILHLKGNIFKMSSNSYSVIGANWVQWRNLFLIL